jgi:NADH pyrophosphatase NudC (nudix superfamily)
MGVGCPGQDSRSLTVSLHMCPSCGKEVEMFSDETRVRCRACGAFVYKETAPTCIEWCAKARECIGDQRWTELMGDRGKEPETDAGSGD